jgi:isoquinoline 1-oxidoreductase subunit alpha
VRIDLSHPDYRGESGMAFTLKVNGETHSVDVDPDTPLLWVLRDNLKLTGTKFGCGIAQCGACTVHLNGQAQRSCVLPISAVGDQEVRTIDSLADHPIQQAWIAHEVPQCGYCQSGMVMAAVSLLDGNPEPTDADIDQAMTNICRCGTYNRVRAAIHSAAKAGA